MSDLGGLFNYDNKFFRTMNKLVDGVCASLLWVLFCLPVVTAGASTTAFYYTVHKVLRGNRGYVWRTFWSGFKSNFKQTTKIWLILLVMFVILFYDRSFAYENFIKSGSNLGVLYYFFTTIILFVAVWAVYIFAYSARFEMDMKNTMKNAGIIAVVNLPWSFLILLIFAAAAFIVWLLSPFWLAFLPGIVGYVYDIILERIFRRYMSPEDLKREEELDMQNREY